MNIVGDGHIKFYGPEDEVPRPVSTSERWNESVWLHFLDAKRGVVDNSIWPVTPVSSSVPL